MIDGPTEVPSTSKGIIALEMAPSVRVLHSELRRINYNQRDAFGIANARECL